MADSTTEPRHASHRRTLQGDAGRPGPHDKLGSPDRVGPRSDRASVQQGGRRAVACCCSPDQRDALGPWRAISSSQPSVTVEQIVGCRPLRGQALRRDECGEAVLQISTSRSSGGALCGESRPTNGPRVGVSRLLEQLRRADVRATLMDDDVPISWSPAASRSTTGTRTRSSWIRHSVTSSSRRPSCWSSGRASSRGARDGTGWRVVRDRRGTRDARTHARTHARAVLADAASRARRSALDPEYGAPDLER